MDGAYWDRDVLGLVLGLGVKGGAARARGNKDMAYNQR